MKNRKRIVVLFLLLAVALVGVGYAALSDTLTIIGNAHIDIDTANKTFDERIYFSAAEATSTTGTGTTADVASYTADDATFTANRLAILGEESVFTFTIKNDSNVAAKIAIEAKKLSGDDNPSNSNTTIFKVTYNVPAEGFTVAAGASVDIIVTVEVINPVTSATSATFGVELTATTIG